MYGVKEMALERADKAVTQTGYPKAQSQTEINYFETTGLMAGWFLNSKIHN